MKDKIVGILCGMGSEATIDLLPGSSNILTQRKMTITSGS